MNVLVTGGAGFIGSWIVEELLRLGHKVLILDDMSGGDEANIAPGADAKFFDLRDHKKTQEAFEAFDPELVYHLACHPHEGLSQFMPYDIASSVLMASVSVFRAAVNTGVERVVNFSSMARYGRAGGKTPPYAEWDPAIPVDVYGAAKYAAEGALNALAEAHGMEYVHLAPHNVIGPRQSREDPYRNVISIWTNRLMKGLPPIIYGDGEQRRAFSDVRDSLPCYILAGIPDGKSRSFMGTELCSGTDGQVINIGGKEHVSINEAAQITIEEFGSDLEAVHVDDRPCEVKNAFCTISKSEALLDFKQTRPVRESIRDFIEWAKEQGPAECRYIDKSEVEITKNLPKVWADEEI